MRISLRSISRFLLVPVSFAAVEAMSRAPRARPPRRPSRRSSTVQRQFEADIRRRQRERIRFNRSRRRSGENGAYDNLRPPDELFVAETVPRTPIDPALRDRLRAEIRATDAEALAFVEARIAAQGSRGEFGAVKVKSDIDQWGDYHGEFMQSFRGVPLTKGSMVVHIPLHDREPRYEDHFIDDLPDDLDTHPVVSDSTAAATALAAADPTGRYGHRATVSLKLHPLFFPGYSASTRGQVHLIPGADILRDVVLV